GVREQHPAHLHAGFAQPFAALLDRHAARGVALVRAVRRARRHDAHALESDVELFRGNLRERGMDALPELHLAARDPHRAVALEADPRVLHGCISFAARSTARTTRLCAPQRHRLRSNASLTCFSDGSGFWERSATAATAMPLMQ